MSLLSKSNIPLNTHLHPCIDFHTHAYPETMFRHKISEHYLQKLKGLSKYYSSIGHAIQQKMHQIPEAIRKNFDPLLLSSTLPPLAVNSTADDLIGEMRRQHVTHAIVASHPPLISNQHILSVCSKNTSLIPCLTVSDEITSSDFFKLENLREPKFLIKLNPMATDFNPEAPLIKNLLHFWNQKSWPILIHTGALYSSFFKRPDAGNIQNLSTLVGDYPHIHFILLHMNIFKPYDALEFCQKYTNTSVTTSWQSEDLISIAHEKLGSQRLLFSSDWPLLGDNIAIRKNSILNLKDKKHLSDIEAENIFFNNAKNILENYFSKKL